MLAYSPAFADFVSDWEQDKRNMEIFSKGMKDELRASLKNTQFTIGVNTWKEKAEKGEAEAQFQMGKLHREGDGKNFYYDKALEWYQKSAAQGYAPAQTDLAGMYFNGMGVTKNDAEAARLIKLAVAGGYQAAMINLGILYEQGRGVVQSNVYAYKWFHLSTLKDPENKALQSKRDELAKKMNPEQLAEAKVACDRSIEEDEASETLKQSKALFERRDYDAALQLLQPLVEKGVAEAQFQMGELHDGQHGRNRSDNEMAKWFRKAAEQGHSDAQSRLGSMYSVGTSATPQNHIQAYMWASLAAASGDKLKVSLRDMNEIHMSPEDIAKAKRMASEWKPVIAPK